MASPRPRHYSTDGLERECNGLGTLHCYCGGDQCVCAYNGETECPGCVQCQPTEEHDFGGEFDPELGGEG